MKDPTAQHRPDPQAHCLTTGHPGETTSATFGRIASPAPWTADVLCGQASAGESRHGLDPNSVYLDDCPVENVHASSIQKHASRFEWGVKSPGAAQLAFALLLEVVSPAEALTLRFRFAAEVISAIPKGVSPLCLSRQEIHEWARRAAAGGEYA